MYQQAEWGTLTHFKHSTFKQSDGDDDDGDEEDDGFHLDLVS